MTDFRVGSPPPSSELGGGEAELGLLGRDEFLSTAGELGMGLCPGAKLWRVGEVPQLMVLLPPSLLPPLQTTTVAAASVGGLCELCS